MTGHRARKRFGQHFLTSPEAIGKIVDVIAPTAKDVVVEIGPGRGAITAPLAACAGELHAVEFDRDLVPVLSEQFAGAENVTIHEADALLFDFARLGPSLRIVGNLPYNISTPLLFHLLQFRNNIDDMHFMLQKEVVDRICAAPGGKRYGRLTIMLGCHLDAVSLFDVPPAAFSPPPRVVSSIVRLQPASEARAPIRNANLLNDLVRQAFSRRRKTLRNALKGMATETELSRCGLDPAQRPEEVPVHDWIKLANSISEPVKLSGTGLE